ncbi:hypothetical protein Pla123a_38880 [Posidoniimonas polymericola]|uniref:Uncharacterized protein n=1 Tax=Posidoniimonas polymericola TaxID=2528002 RepID=A0A5C5YHX1_9BACT|nr:hypothetical protein [Posidoniimonas polymericola]TWT73552.1 hypothetical protein Pla123a_38880 [Posidoniimonas polymericola]
MIASTMAGGKETGAKGHAERTPGSAGSAVGSSTLKGPGVFAAVRFPNGRNPTGRFPGGTSALGNLVVCGRPENGRFADAQ